MSTSIAYTGLDDDASASAVLDSVIADFAGHWDLPGVVFHVGEQYHDRAFRLEKEDLETERLGWTDSTRQLKHAVTLA